MTSENLTMHNKVLAYLIEMLQCSRWTFLCGLLGK
jgi:hypothetical protein